MLTEILPLILLFFNDFDTHSVSIVGFSFNLEAGSVLDVIFTVVLLNFDQICMNLHIILSQIIFAKQKVVLYLFFYLISS